MEHGHPSDSRGKGRRCDPLSTPISGPVSYLVLQITCFLLHLKWHSFLFLFPWVAPDGDANSTSDTKNSRAFFLFFFFYRFFENFHDRFSGWPTAHTNTRLVLLACQNRYSEWLTIRTTCTEYFGRLFFLLRKDPIVISWWLISLIPSLGSLHDWLLEFIKRQDRHTEKPQRFKFHQGEDADGIV